MNAGTSAVARIAGIAIVLVVAAALGLAVGNALNQRHDDPSAEAGPNIGNFVPENQGGTHTVRAWRIVDYVPRFVRDAQPSRTADATFSIEALGVLNMIRAADAADAADDSYVDYGPRHPELGTADENRGQRKAR
jgi:hypothetical protein